MLFNKPIWLLSSSFIINFISGHACYYCVSYAHLLEVNLRYQLGSQTDIFHWPTNVSSPGCSNPSSLIRTSYQLYTQTCIKFPICATISIKIPNVNFVIRGCMEQILVTKLRIDERFQKKGCYKVRSKQFRPTIAPLDYIICVCTATHCNSDVQNSFVHSSQPESESESVYLLSTVKSERLAGVTGGSYNLGTTPNSLFTFTVSLLLARILWNA